MTVGLLVLLGVSLSHAALPAQSVGGPDILPRPTGDFGIGRVTYHWVDSSRSEFLDAHADTHAGRHREVVVDVWYPAGRRAGQPRTSRAPYLPDLAELTRVLGDSAARREFAPAYGAVASGRLHTHATEGTPATCPAGGCPVLIFSHGGGVDRSSYTFQYEALASHGYVVAAIAHLYDTHLVVLPDGRLVRAAPAFRDTLPVDSTLPRWRRDWERELRSQAHLRRVIDVAVADIRFVIDRLGRYARDPALGAPFARALDLTRLGALGHSAGGEAAAIACQTDARLKACLDEDGAMHNLPFARDAAGRTMRQPFMYIGQRVTPPRLSDQQLAAMELTRAEADSVLHAIATGQDDLIADMPGGAYRVRLKGPGITHMSFSDEPLIEAAGDSTKTADARLALATVATYTRAFFDVALRGRTGTPLDPTAAPDTAVVELERFPPAAAAQPMIRNAAGLALMADSTEAGPVLLLQLPDASIDRRAIRVLAPEHATVREVGATDARQLFRYDRVQVRWVRQGQALTYRRELLPGLTLDVTATLDSDGVRVRYAYTNRTGTAYALTYAPTDPRLTGPFHDVRLERTWVHRAGGFALLASDVPERLTLPLDRWLPARVLDAYTWPVPAEKVRREGGITYYDAAQPVDEPMLSTVSADGRWTVTSFTATVGNVWSNPELTCQHVDPTPPLPAHATAIAETKLLVTRGSLADALRAVRAQRSRLAADTLR